MKELPILPVSEGERKRAMENALTNPMDVDTSKSLYGMVAAITAAHPHRVAISESTGQMTYGDLLRRVAGIRRSLLEHGCGVGSRIASLAPRGTEAVATFLAVESLGAVYVPADPSWPVARIVHILRGADVDFLLTGHYSDGPNEKLLPIMEATADSTVQVSVAQDSGAEDHPDPSSWLPRAPHADEPRYILHTSGSTGQPKGVVVAHQGMVNHLWSMVAALELGDEDVVAFSAPPTYVVSVWQMLAPLLVGARIAVLDEEQVRVPRSLPPLLARAKITVLQLVPTVLGLLVDHVRRSSNTTDLASLRHLISTGEELPPELARRTLETLPRVRLTNAYGATECSDDVTHHVVGSADLDRARIPIGKPIPNASLFLLVAEHDSWRAARPGEVGELFVGGLPVGLGYLGAETGVAFFVDTLDPASPTGRIYRTGDLARFDGGVLHCLGRADRQVKVAGVRIELDEIEAVLLRLPEIACCGAVLDRGGWSAQITMYYVARKPVAKEDLQRHLLASLPGGMLPRHWVEVDELPLRANGKIDRLALNAKEFT